MFEAVIPVVRQFTRTLAPVLDQLAPIIAELAQALGGELIKLLPVFQAGLTAFVPLIKSYADQMVRGLRDQAAMLIALNAVKAAFESVSEVVRSIRSAVIDGLKTILGPMMKVFSPVAEMFEGVTSSGLSLRENLSRLAIAISAVAVKIGAMFSGDENAFDEFKTKVLGGLKLKTGDPALAAAQNPQTIAADQLGQKGDGAGVHLF